MKYLALILALLMPQMAFARIGETPEACEKRYGGPTKAWPDGSREYYADKCLIVALFRESVCWKIHYVKGDGNLSDEVLESLLSKEAKDWRQTKNQKQTVDRGPLKRWETDSLKAYWIGGNQLVIYTKAGMKRYEAEKAAEDVKAAE